MRLILHAESGPRDGEVFSIDSGDRLTFGRTTSADISFPLDGHMSGLHCEVSCTDSDAEVIDRGSTNGTWLNDRRITSAVLQANDLLRAGKSVFRVEISKVADDFPQDRIGGGTPAVEPGHRRSEFPAEEGFTQAPSGQSQRPVVPASNFESFSPGNVSDPAQGFEPLPRRESPPPRVEPKTDVPPPRRDEVPRQPDRPAKKPDAPSVPKAFSGSPIESLDLGPGTALPGAEDEQLPPDVPMTPAAYSDNPFSDASVSFKLPPKEAVPVSASRGDTVTTNANELVAFQRFPPADLAETFEFVLTSLARHYSLKLVAHFQKIRTAPPDEFRSARPVCDFFGAGGEGTSAPVLLDGTCLESPSFKGVLPRMCRADAIAAFVGEESKSLEAMIRELMRAGLDGFSENGGFLPFCWPSGLMFVSQVRGLEAVHKLFGKGIPGVVFCTPERKPRVMAFAQGSLQEILKSMEFQACGDTLH